MRYFKDNINILFVHFLGTGKSKTSQVTYTSAIKQFLAFIDKELRSVVLEDFQLWVRSLEMRYSSHMVKNKVNAIKSLLSFGQINETT